MLRIQKMQKQEGRQEFEVESFSEARKLVSITNTPLQGQDSKILLPEAQRLDEGNKTC